MRKSDLQYFGAGVRLVGTGKKPAQNTFVQSSTREHAIAKLQISVIPRLRDQHLGIDLEIVDIWYDQSGEVI